MQNNLPQKDILDNRIKPFLKWAGGKRWFVANYPDLIPKEYNTYIEPFLGSGAVFFNLKPEKAILGDLNGDLINTYLGIKHSWEEVLDFLEVHREKHSTDYYYSIRSETPINNPEIAARFIYLNRTCWNGLYRVNKKGKFNVPIGTRSSIIYDNDNFEGISRLLQNAHFHSTDFEDLIKLATKGDLLFVDPPYTVRHNNNGFIKYNENLFSWKDQERLASSLIKAKNRGVKILGTNACHESVKDLYVDSFDHKIVSRNSLISPKTETRSKFEEFIFFTG